MRPPIRVGIRGVSGHLGRRLFRSIGSQVDMMFSLGIFREDAMLPEFLEIARALRALDALPAATYALDADTADVHRLNASQSICQFVPLSRVDVADMCDVLVDTTGPNVSTQFRASDERLGIPVILQLVESEGAIIAAPIVSRREGAFFRQGDCLLSAVAPILSALPGDPESIRCDVHMQVANYLQTYPMLQRINGTYLNGGVAKMFSGALRELFPDSRVKAHVRQVAGTDYYTIALEAGFAEAISHERVVDCLARAPRVCLVPASIASTYEVDHLLREPIVANGGDLSPVVVFTRTMEPRPGEESRTIELDIAVYSRTVAIYGNIDAIRCVMRPELAPRRVMQMTDEYARLVTHLSS